MKQTTFELLINRLVECEKKNELLRYKNTELNGIKQSHESNMAVMKNTIILLEARLKDKIKEIKQEDND
jgi:hypothetical protein